MFMIEPILISYIKFGILIVTVRPKILTTIRSG
jgi:hypothetical protein